MHFRFAELHLGSLASCHFFLPNPAIETIEPLNILHSSSINHLLLVIQDVDGSVSEFEIWQGLSNLYSSLSYWRDAEICLQKARTFKSYSAATLNAEGESKCIVIRIAISHLFDMHSEIIFLATPLLC